MLGPPRLALHSYDPKFSVVPEATQSKDLEGRSALQCQLKKPIKVQDVEKGIAGRNEREQYSLKRGVINLPSRQINDFLPKRK